MKSKMFINGILCLVFLSLLFVLPVSSDDSIDNKILDVADGLFKDMKEKNYTGIWDSITPKSKVRIIEDVFSALEKSKDEKYSIEQITNDFNVCGKICKSYWNGYLENFNPDFALEQSKWEMGKVKENEAQIIIKYKKAEKPAVLKMFKEEGSWHVGLVETFWSRK